MSVRQKGLCFMDFNDCGGSGDNNDHIMMAGA